MFRAVNVVLGTNHRLSARYSIFFITKRNIHGQSKQHIKKKVAKIRNYEIPEFTQVRNNLR